MEYRSATIASWRSHACTSRCCDPTWNDTPTPSPWSAARTINRLTSSVSHPNLRDSGQSAPMPSHSMRQKTVEPGAVAITLSSSRSQSTANRRTPFAYACSMAATFFTVFPYEIRAGSAPAARQASTSPGLATSNEAPRSVRSSSTSGAGFAFTAKKIAATGIAQARLR